MNYGGKAEGNLSSAARVNKTLGLRLSVRVQRYTRTHSDGHTSIARENK